MELPLRPGPKVVLDNRIPATFRLLINDISFPIAFSITIYSNIYSSTTYELSILIGEQTK